MKLLYFAWLKVKTGVSEEEVTPPDEVATVAELLAWLQTRGPNYAEALSDLSALRVAVNQEYAKPGDPVAPGDEIALFPPVTGG
jgi:molybdopterin synthase sulfur carrier subunit